MAPHSNHRLLNLSVTIYCALICAWIFSTPLRHLPQALGYLQDDFYYYAQIARNIVRGHGSSFDGIVRTNGYQPLYLLLICAAAQVGEKLGNGTRTMLLVLWALNTAAALTTFLVARRILSWVNTNAVLTNALALVALIIPIRLFFLGMEISLTIPLELLLLAIALRTFDTATGSEASPTGPAAVSPASMAALGVTAAAMVLSRLDSALFVVLLSTGVLASPTLRRSIGARAAAAFSLAAGLPLLGYVLFNRSAFGVWEPISGMAKQMRLNHGPSAIALRTALEGNGRILFTIVLFAFALFAVHFRNLRPAWRVSLFAASAFPLAHMGVLIFLSDWRIWSWYHYSFVPSTMALLALLAFTLERSRTIQTTRSSPLRYVSYALLALFALALPLNRWRLNPEMHQIAETAVSLQRFSWSHSGVYAMGDRAGMSAWLLSNPVFQTEGLVEDRGWLDVIRRQGDLVGELRRRGVRYYVMTEWSDARYRSLSAHPPAPGCVSAIEPMQAGPSAPHLESQICSPPVAVLVTPSIDWAPAKRTLIFDLSQ